MFEQLRDRLVAWQTYRETVYQLSLLDRHLLEDVGVPPASIRVRAAAATRVSREPRR
jgi:uncharacterized protein YjiS (DUF1127 family)